MCQSLPPRIRKCRASFSAEGFINQLGSNSKNSTHHDVDAAPRQSSPDRAAGHCVAAIKHHRHSRDRCTGDIGNDYNQRRQSATSDHSFHCQWTAQCCSAHTILACQTRSSGQMDRYGASSSGCHHDPLPSTWTAWQQIRVHRHSHNHQQAKGSNAGNMVVQA